MTTPSPDGKFATQDDVTSRFEGTIPSNRLAWVTKRIGDVESELMFQVPSLRKSVPEIDAESTAAGDEDRLNRVKSLVADKVLDLYRNPGGPGQVQQSTTTPDITVSRGWNPADRTRGRVQFSAEELEKVRMPSRRPKFGTIMIQPGFITR
ncbi:hypothetical protein BCA37_10760 [Mycobacterium sp. djl-10]|nr:hypothetical protein BCA37_10760 [Mycobacterium sp. djl-10]